jgi:hypothetical protein
VIRTVHSATLSEPAPLTSSHPRPAPCAWFSRLAAVLDCRSASHLALLFCGAAPTGWHVYFCTQGSARVAAILAAVANRFAPETALRAVVAGQQQERFVWASLGAFHLCLWTFTMTEAWA